MTCNFYLVVIQVARNYFIKFKFVFKNVNQITHDDVFIKLKILRKFTKLLQIIAHFQFFNSIIFNFSLVFGIILRKFV